jgi:threonine dehydrogenase-like Zn-dependent dehydrogenase
MTSGISLDTEIEPQARTMDGLTTARAERDGRHRVVIVGCGFGGLFADRALRRADVDVTGFKNRFAVLANWIVASLGHRRPQRAITAQQVFGREALESQADAIAAAMAASPAHEPNVPQHA